MGLTLDQQATGLLKYHWENRTKADLHKLKIINFEEITQDIVKTFGFGKPRLTSVRWAKRILSIISNSVKTRF